MRGSSGASTSLLAAYRRVNKPYYLWRPAQTLARVHGGRAPWEANGVYLDVELPWGVPYRCRAREKTGLEIRRRGLFDLTVSETLYRLTDPGDHAVDVGANLGHMTSILGLRAGEHGAVDAFEPHPVLFEELRWNVERWTPRPDFAPVRLHRLALASFTGTAMLRTPTEFDWNMGSASLEGGEDGAAVGGVEGTRVDVARLDEVHEGTIGVMKVDVEGHELEVFEGASGLLASQRVRDIVFEDFREPPTPAIRHLKSAGYEVFSLDHALLGPLAGAASDRSARLSGGDPSYLATADPERAKGRLRRRGWACLGVRGLPRR